MALIESMSILLGKSKFAKLTVEMICQKGQISRATFYSHFADKYNLLKTWLMSFWTYRAKKNDGYEYTKESINSFVAENKSTLKNILVDADDETFAIFQSFIVLVLDLGDIEFSAGFGGRGSSTRPGSDNKLKHIVAENLFVGGILSYILWQIKNDFPDNVPMINEYSFEAIKMLWNWTKGQ